VVLDLGSKQPQRQPDAHDFGDLHNILSTLKDLQRNTTDKTLAVYCGIAVVAIELAMEVLR